MNRADIEHLAADLLKDAGITEPPVDLRVLAERCDAIITMPADMPEDMDGMVIPGWSMHLIAINPNRPPNRRRFTLAHEIGHLFLHGAEGVGCKLSMHVPRYELQPEREASLFAAMVTMCPDWMRNDVAAGLTDERALARRYRVSPQAMRFQLYDLGLSEAADHLARWPDGLSPSQSG